MLKTAIPTLMLAGALLLGCATSQAATPPPTAPVATDMEVAVSRTLSLSDDLWECMQVNNSYRSAFFQQMAADGKSKREIDALLSDKERFRGNTWFNIQAGALTLAEVEEVNAGAAAALDVCRDGA